MSADIYRFQSSDPYAVRLAASEGRVRRRRLMIFFAVVIVIAIIFIILAVVGVIPLWTLALDGVFLFIVAPLVAFMLIA